MVFSMGATMNNREQGYGLTDEETDELRKRIDIIFMRDYSYLEWLMQTVDGAQPETLVAKKERRKR